MKKMIISVLLISIVFLSFTPSVSADTTCFYNSSERSGGYYEYGELTIKDPSNSNAKASFQNLMGPKLDCSGWADAGVYGACVLTFFIGCGIAANLWADNMCSFRANDLKTNDLKDYSSAASKNLNTKLSYIDAQGKKQSVNLPNTNLGSECPEYLGVVISDSSDASNVQVFAGDSSTKNFIDNYINSNPDYNYVIWGSEFERTGHDSSDGSGGGSSQDDSNLNTCVGVLGNKVNGEYESGSVGALLQQIFDYMKMAAVILVFVFSVIDYAKAIAAQNADAFKKANVNLLKRIIFGIVFFLIPTLVNLILSVIDSSTCGIQ